ncbi:MAG: hypothetical protein KDC44_01565 [Phaeodactylibacter sp.]|nr:hypothetical protein [Phaeodactylibacter sp.]
MIPIKNHKLLISLRKDRAVLLACMFIALVFWFFVKLSKPYATTWDFALTINAPKGQAFLSLPPDEVVARVQGRGWDLLNYSLFRVPIALRFDLTDGASLNINGRMLRERLSQQLANRHIEVLDVNYDIISLTAEMEVTRRLRLQPALQLNFLAGYNQNGPYTVQPDSISITGPESLVAELHVWKTDTLILEDIRSDYTGKVKVATPMDPVLRVKPQEAELFIPVEPFVEQSFFAKVQVHHAPDSLIIFPPSVKLTYVAGVSKLHQINAESFQVFVDLEGFDLKSTNNTVPLIVSYSNPAIQSVQIDPPSIEFFFEMSDSSMLTRTVVGVDSAGD